MLFDSPVRVATSCLFEIFPLGYFVISVYQPLFAGKEDKKLKNGMLSEGKMECSIIRICLTFPFHRISGVTHLLGVLEYCQFTLP